MRDQAGNRRFRRLGITTVVVLAIAGMNGPWLYRFGTERYHQYVINKPEYKAANGHWQVVEFPKEYRQDTIHAVLLHTGKVLLIAGSGNDQDNFDAKKFDSRIWDPVKGTIKKIPTPADLFCTGHTQLANGNILIAGGTKRYEKLKGDVKKAGGVMIVYNENPDKPMTLKAGTRFTGKANGKTFVSMDSVLIPRAKKVFDKKTGTWLRNDPGYGRVNVEAPKEGTKYETGTQDNYSIQGLTGADGRNTYGIANKLGMDKRDFEGIKNAYEFDPVAEKYIKVDPMNEARWYPTLTTLSDGKVLSVSGLDDIGQLVPGKNEEFDPKTKTWTYTKTTRQFPTYPALFLLQNGKIFYSGSNAGYGPDNVGRTPGVWDVDTNQFTVVPGLSDANAMETSGTVLLPPAQDEKFMVIGGGGVGESKVSSNKTRIVDLKAKDPEFVDGPTLEKGTRYPQTSILPDDTVLVSGGSQDYRGRSASDIKQARIYHPDTNSFEQVADPLVGRDYHSGSILLPDGRVMFFGSNPLYADKANTKPGGFEQRIEIYTPSYLYHGSRPSLSGGPQTIARGASGTFTSPQAADIKKVRLIRPSSTTHVTDVDQRSIALDYTVSGDKITVTVPKNKNLVTSGWYMLFVDDDQGTPSVAQWVKVP
ncbi:kelch motif-containing protein [Streptomyces mangrovisoli]|uniref:Galactose oxidase n=1 Tax=Streptomyces mangrovisoli TaxID=1428628 RepID=A0A1J4NNG2_9ACTN|nr:kelch motif-containing protein [Streptomyces mangrovisoli]OIJ62694.1 galactose oxidase [Streptomyces mangrovisoli]